ncbi:MAG: PhnD/SsuA/transferrin family substrate-binding protein [Desulfuromonadaceae bacterium]|nr:PhnD/SsuA/transferrin family substrate-binding protein [Desulfuromonadaceae bacterium]
MRIARLIVLVVWCCLPTLAFSAQPSRTLRFSPLPLESEHYVKKQFSCFCRSLAAMTQQKIELVYKKDYVDILSALHHDEIDLAYLGPLPYVKVREADTDIVPLVRFLSRNGESTYTCSLVAFGHNRPDLQETCTTVALTQPYSTCGYLVTEALLSSFHQSLQQCPYTYAGNHEQAALAVVRGEAVLAGVKTAIARQYENLGLTVLQESTALPGFLLVANQRTLGKEQVDMLRQNLLAREPQSISEWGELVRYGMIEAKNEDYDVIRTLLKRHPIPDIAP